MDKEFAILSLFFEHPNREFHVRETAKLTKISHRSASKYLSKLAKDGFLAVEKGKAKLINYKADTENGYFIEYKRFYNMLKLRRSGLIDFLNKVYSHPTIIIFGSYSRAEDTEKSDADIFILSETKKEINLSNYENKINRKVQLFVMNDDEFEKAKKSSPNLINNIINGIKISGILEVFR
ncbi:TPA: nucleotidyltransferase domain-containing protein [Candidatus Woesearchaeota archaeon]|nr:nucleotidyltransferase domain-containing protein [Candidatus Woesearchaeota archaeon]